MEFIYSDRSSSGHSPSKDVEKGKMMNEWGDPESNQKTKAKLAMLDGRGKCRKIGGRIEYTRPGIIIQE